MPKGHRLRRSRLEGESPSTSGRQRLSPVFFAGLLLTVFGFVGGELLQARQNEAVPDPDLSKMEPQVASKIRKTRAAVLEDPESHEAWGRLGMVFQAHGMEEEAAECYRHAALLEPGELRWHYLRAHALRDTDLDAAAAEAELAVKAGPDYVPAHVLRGELLEESGGLEPAVQAYNKALELDPECALAEFGLGRVYLAQRDLEKSFEHLLRARKLSEAAGAIHATLARVYRLLGEREAAVKESRLASELTGIVGIADPVHFEMRQEAVSSLALLDRAKAADEKGESGKAEALYRRLLQIRPEDADMHARLADNLTRQGRYEEAKEEYGAALDIHPQHAWALYGQGNVLTFEKHYKEALRRYEDSLSIRPDHVPTLVNLASLLAFQGRLEEAAARLRRALEIAPDHFGCQRELGRVLMRQRKPAEAVPHLRAALKSRPDAGPVHAELAVALAATGAFRQAWEEVEEAERLGASFPPKFLEALERALPRPVKK